MGASHTGIGVEAPVITGMDDGEFSDNKEDRSKERQESVKDTNVS